LRQSRKKEEKDSDNKRAKKEDILEISKKGDPLFLRTNLL